MDSVLGLQQFAESLGIDLRIAKRKLRRAGASADDVLQEGLMIAHRRKMAGKPINPATAIRSALKNHLNRAYTVRQSKIESLS